MDDGTFYINAPVTGTIELMSVTIPSSLTSIGVGIFQGCFSVSQVVLNNGLTSISASMFYLYSNTLTTITIPSSVIGKIKY